MWHRPSQIKASVHVRAELLIISLHDEIGVLRGEVAQYGNRHPVNDTRGCPHHRVKLLAADYSVPSLVCLLECLNPRNTRQTQSKPMPLIPPMPKGENRPLPRGFKQKETQIRKKTKIVKATTSEESIKRKQFRRKKDTSSRIHFEGQKMASLPRCPPPPHTHTPITTQDKQTLPILEWQTVASMNLPKTKRGTTSVQMNTRDGLYNT
jgi:hypothetical protein